MTGASGVSRKTQISMHRRGLPEAGDSAALRMRGAWPTPQLTFAFEQSPGQPDRDATFQAVRRAFATWSAAVPFTCTEVPATAGPDVVIAWRPARQGDCPMAGDLESAALHQIGHVLGLPHSDVPGSVMFPPAAGNVPTRAPTADDLRSIRQLYPPAVLPNGPYAIRHRSTGRFLDAHEIAEQAFRLVTRPAQDSDTQRWQLTKVGTVFLIRQRSTGRYLDAYESPEHDFRVVTRIPATTATQRWIAMADGDGACTLRQLSSRRFIDAHETPAQDFALVTQAVGSGGAPKWIVRRVAAHTFTIRQTSSGRFAGADANASPDAPVSTCPDPDERWIFSPVGAVYAVVHASTFQLMDGDDGADGPLATRPPRSHDAQRWIVMPALGGSFTVQQLSSGAFLDAPGSAADDRVVASGAENDATQCWMFEKR